MEARTANANAANGASQGGLGVSLGSGGPAGPDRASSLTHGLSGSLDLLGSGLWKSAMPAMDSMMSQLPPGLASGGASGGPGGATTAAGEDPAGEDPLAKRPRVQ